MKFWVLLIAVVMAFGSVSSMANEDARGSSDHPAISRFPDSRIQNYKYEEFAEYELATGPLTAGRDMRPPSEKLEGEVTTIIYKLNAVEKSALQIFRSYEKALGEKGLKTTFRCSNAACGDRFARQLVKDTPRALGYNGFDVYNITSKRWDYHFLSGYIANGDKRLYLQLSVKKNNSGSMPAMYVLDIVEPEEILLSNLAITPESLAKDIATTGRAVLDGITFDFDKAALTPQSSEGIASIATYMKGYPGSSFFVVGHTDMQGDLQYNEALSRRRANTVLETLVSAHGIEASRLSARGVGPLSPVNSNASNAGRGENRRVELVLREVVSR